MKVALPSRPRPLVRLVLHSRRDVVVQVPAKENRDIVRLGTSNRLRRPTRAAVLSGVPLYDARQGPAKPPRSLLLRRVGRDRRRVHTILRLLRHGHDSVACHGPWDARLAARPLDVPLEALLVGERRAPAVPRPVARVQILLAASSS